MPLVPVDHDPVFAGDSDAPAAAPAAAPQRRGLIKDSDLDEAVPVNSRRVGEYTPNVGTMPVAGGADWDKLDLKRAGSGMQADPEKLQQWWNDAVDKVKAWSPEQGEALTKYFDDHPEVGPGTPQFWNNALKQLDRARYWYEVSTRRFEHEGLDQGDPRRAQLGFDTVAATSPQAEPELNLRRAIGVMAEHEQREPSSMDLMTPGSVRIAFAPSQALEAPKIGNFSGTFAHIAGINPKAPISVNDRQVADIHGIDRNELAKNPALYAVLSHFYQNFRDGENAARPGVAAGTENPFESWQLRALGWTQNRGEKRTAKAGEAGIDDYSQVMDRLKGELENAGVDTKPGILSREVLSDPRVPDIMSGTRRHFLATPIATVETGSTMHPEGQAAADLLAQLPSGAGAPKWADTARKSYEMIQRRAMKRLAAEAPSGDNKGYSILDRLAAPIVGAKVKIRRVDTDGGWGQFMGDIAPNARIPMWGVAARSGQGADAQDVKAGDRLIFTPEQVKPLLAALGHDLGQRAMAASRFRTVAPEELAAGKQPDTWSVFVPELDRPRTPVEQLDRFGRALGLPLNIARGPSGTLADVNVGGFEGRMPPLTAEEVEAAANQAFGDAPFRIIDRNYSSHYLVHPDEPDAANDGARQLAGIEPRSYDWHLGNFWSGVDALDRTPPGADTGRVRAPDWDAGRRLGDFNAAREEVRGVTAQLRAEAADWTRDNQARLDRHNQRLERAALRARGGLTAAAQAAQPPPYRLIPVDELPPFAGAAE